MSFYEKATPGRLVLKKTAVEFTLSKGGKGYNK
jgi:hypothetical protein